MSAASSTQAATPISLPQGGGAMRGLGEKFAPDLFTGSGNFSVPIALPAGRRGLQPELSLQYSSGAGQGPFGLGWSLSLPGVARKTSHGLPRYNEATTLDDERKDTFILSGAEDLVAVAGAYPGRRRYRPRTEGLFARIEHVREGGTNHWEVRSRDGLVTRYGTPRPTHEPGDWLDPAVTRDPTNGDAERIFAWHITETVDSFGNLVRYEYLRDRGVEAGHAWDRPFIRRIVYADYGERAAPSFLVAVDFDYESRPDAFSEHRAGFEQRTTLRCRAIRVCTQTHDGRTRAARELRLHYQQAPFNGTSLLAQIEVLGFDDAGQVPPAEQVPPLRFGYSAFDPERRRFDALSGRSLPALSFTDSDMALVDVRGAGLPDLLQMGASPRWWANLGSGRFDAPQSMQDGPPLSLRDAGVQVIDADGDGRSDLLVSHSPLAGYFPMLFGGAFSRRSFQPYTRAPSFDLDAPGVRLVDLDGDGLADVLRAGTRLQCWFNDADPARAWQRSHAVATTSLDGAPEIDLADPHVRLADMTGDGLQDLVLVRSGHVAYWPNLGHGRWGAQVQMQKAPRFPDGHDPQRVLLADIDGDGLADLIYVEQGKVSLWANRSGNAFSDEPVIVRGTPALANTDTVQVTDLYGQGTGGLLWSRVADAVGRPNAMFLDFTGGVKPYLLDTMDNQLGALTRIAYRPSTVDFLRDQRDARTRWRTPLPFPVQVVARTEVIDALSHGKLSTEYRYHHGYWDGVEREFRGFARVDQLDSESFEAFASGGGQAAHFSPPTLAKTWFHVGPIGGETGREPNDWRELDLSHEYWPGDPNLLARPSGMRAFLAGLPRRPRRDALRTLRGQALRSELYAQDGSVREERPYTVTESLSGVREEVPPSAGDGLRERIFFPFPLAQRSTQWERGDEPKTEFSFSSAYDEYGFAHQQLDVAVPRGRNPLQPASPGGEPLLATYDTTEYARRDDGQRYIVDRVSRTTQHEVLDDGGLTVFELRDAVFGGAGALRLIGHARSYYDGEAFVGLPLGRLGEHGVAVRSESLVFDDAFLARVFDPRDPKAVSPRPAYLRADANVAWTAEYPPGFRQALPARAGYVYYGDFDVEGSPGGFYVVGERHRFDFHDTTCTARGMLLATRDALGSESTLAYDAHDLLPVRATDAAGLATQAVYDPRVLQPSEVTDANGTTTRVSYTSTGQVSAQFVRGQRGEGDAEHASVSMSYDLLAFRDRGQPVQVRKRSRVHHDSDTDVPAERRDDAIESVEYSDGFGRLLQTRSLAEDTLFGDPLFGGAVIPPDQGTPSPRSQGRTRAGGEPVNVVVSGWQVYDNKGRVVEAFEPFFASGWAYAAPSDAQLGQKARMFHDPRGQLVRTLAPDGSEQRVVFGVPADLSDPEHFAPTPWEAYSYDGNDNAGRTHAQASGSYASHWNTPSSVVIDALGRTVFATERNGPNPAIDWLSTRSRYDIQGNLLSLTDALGREALRCVFDLAQRRWRIDSIDAGRRDSVPDALGNAVEVRDSKAALTLQAFDRLHRPVRLWARDARNHVIALRQRLAYGDAGSPDQPAAEREAARAQYLLGRLVRHHDEAGLVSVNAVDFRGRLLDSERRVIADAPLLAAYEQARDRGWKVQPFLVNWEPRQGQTLAELEAAWLEATAYRTTSRHDALGRVTLQQLPLDVAGRRRELRPRYNRAGAIERLLLDDAVQVEHIAYDAKGQRTLVAYGNGVMTRCAYDERSFRLRRMLSERYALSGPANFTPHGAPLQDLAYDHDLAGNLLAWHDRTPGCGVPNRADALDRLFAYDPIYRLLSASGRETDLPPDSPPWLDTPRGTDITRARAYTERYAYDPLGNLLRLEHRNAAGGYTRLFTLAPGNNRIHRIGVGNLSYPYSFDANGNLRGETQSRHFEWNHADQLKAFATQIGSAEPSVHAQYLYDAAGQRVKKLVRKQGGVVEVRHYVNGQFEHFRWSGGENNVVHLMDGQRRIALIRSGGAHPDDALPAAQFQLNDHAGSSAVVMDSNGTVLNREEFLPYGETSFGAYAKKRYRFTGKERDEESGLSDHGARHYSAWTCRWLSVEPRLLRHAQAAQAADSPAMAGQADVPPQVHDLWLGPYAYCSASPLVYVDDDGRNPKRVASGVKAEHEAKAKAKLIDVEAWKLVVEGADGKEAGSLRLGTFEASGSTNPGVAAAAMKVRGGTDNLSAEATFLGAGASVGRDDTGKVGAEAEAVLVESKVGGGGNVLGVDAEAAFVVGVTWGATARIGSNGARLGAKVGVGFEFEVSLPEAEEPTIPPAPDMPDYLYKEPETRSSSTSRDNPAPPEPARPAARARPSRGPSKPRSKPRAAEPRTHGCEFRPGLPDPRLQYRPPNV